MVLVSVKGRKSCDSLPDNEELDFSLASATKQNIPHSAERRNSGKSRRNMSNWPSSFRWLKETNEVQVDVIQETREGREDREEDREEG